MDLTYSDADQAFRTEIRTWLEDHLASADWAGLKGLGGPGKDHEAVEERLAWNQHLAAHGWTCVGWPVEHGGRGLSLWQQVVFHEECARAHAPHGVNHLGEALLGPTLMAYGTAEQQARFLPPIREVTELWAQGYSEPDAGSDLANVQTRARLDDGGAEVGGEWVLDGQKVWTSNAHFSQWMFVVARTEPGSQRHRGLSFLLVPIDQPGVEVRPIEQLTGGSEFNEVFLTGARTGADLVVGEPGQGWAVAMALLGFERGVSTLAQTVDYARELDTVVARARANGSYDDLVLRDRLATLKVELSVIRAQGLRGLSSAEPGADSVFKLVWAGWHRRLGEAAMEVAGHDGLLTRSADGSAYDLDDHQRLFLFSRADTIYGGSDEVQKNILAERVLGLPREPRP
ncbi:acyl-CoA dehydrogenase family protein [Nocardioides litoris]|uniref:acyl-CoA dehydrogenase family protein n=1 Tax=Nocardioides litoris TaxID=1926648 RepID=UPI0011229BCC|nr:acyl-CoA dehydrogenase family protein [Nocardioides litoris]